MKVLKATIFLCILMPGITADAMAATHSQQFRNEYDTNRIWLWAVEPTTELTNLTFDNAPVSGWNAPINTVAEMMFEAPGGATVAPLAGRFTVDFAYTTPTFSFEWAEIFWDGATNTLLGSGTATWNGSFWSGSNAFTHGPDLTAPMPAAVPLPASSVFLASGVFLGVGFARRK